jgi:hypothetical protein
MKSAQEFSNISLKLIKKQNPSDTRLQPYLEFIMGNDVSYIHMAEQLVNCFVELTPLHRIDRPMMSF